MRLSVGRKRQCWDNALADSFFATIKTELLDRQPWPTKALAHKAISEYVETSHQLNLSSGSLLILGWRGWREGYSGVVELSGG
jgi:transposase InsO family protein